MEFLTNCGLKEHVGLIHENGMKKRKEICNVCGNEFYKKCSLRKHLKMFIITRRNLANPQIMHSESSPHGGDICDEADCIKTQCI